MTSLATQVNSLTNALTAARSSALVVPAPDLAVFEVRGGDRVSWLNGLITCELANMAPGRAAYGLFVTQKGRILSDAVVLAEAERVLVAVAAERRTEAAELFDKYLIMEDAEVTPIEDARVLRLHGPSAAAVAAAVAGEASVGPLDWSGLGGAVVVTRAAQVDAVLARLVEAGATPGDEGAWEVLRLEQGIPRHGRDFDGTTYPQEAALEKRAVSFNKGCYLGQEVVCMLEMRGHVKRKLVPVNVAGEEAPLPGASVTDAEGKVVGEITSAATSPSGGVVGLAMIKRTRTDAGTVLQVGDRQATVR